MRAHLPPEPTCTANFLWPALRRVRMTTPRAALTQPLLRGVESFTPLLAHSLNGFAVLELASARYAYVSDSLCHLLELDKHVLLGCSCTAVRCVLSRARARGWIRSRGRALLSGLRARPPPPGAPR